MRLGWRLQAGRRRPARAAPAHCSQETARAAGSVAGHSATYDGVWTSVHIPLGVALFMTAFVHIIAALYFATLLQLTKAFFTNRSGVDDEPALWLFDGRRPARCWPDARIGAGLLLRDRRRHVQPRPPQRRGRAAVLGDVRSHAETAGDCGACHTAPWSTATLAIAACSATRPWPTS